MKIAYLHEPELEFGAGRHIDIRFGLMNYGPLDMDSDSAPRVIRCGIVGTPETVEGLADWLDRCRSEIPGKATDKPNLFPRFPGFNPEAAFRSTLVLEPRLQRTIAQRSFDELGKRASRDELVRESVELFRSECAHLVEQSAFEVLLCAVPATLAGIMGHEEHGEEGEGPRQAPKPGDVRLDFHHLLKARVMNLGKPIQLVLPATYDPRMRRRQKNRPERVRQLQDEATIAWNLHTALYYKAGGAPWRLVRDAAQLATCYVGVSFFESLDRGALLTSMAQVFDERGDGLVVRGGPAEVSKDDRQAHLTRSDSTCLARQALKEYRAEHKTLPARVVVCKTSTFTPGEIAGFQAAAADEKVDTIDLLSAGWSLSDMRLFRRGVYPPLRGTFVSLDDRSHVLYTKGSVEFFETYPGMYVPWPFAFRCEAVEQTPRQLAREILALTKMNWNHTQFDGGQPITVEAARRVGHILKYVEQGQTIAARYSFYM